MFPEKENHMNYIILACLGLIFVVVGITGYFLFWLRGVQRTMLAYQEMVDEAREQLSVWKKRAEENSDLETLEILVRSAHIYRQAVNLYNDELSRPWIYLTARLIGFRRIPLIDGG